MSAPRLAARKEALELGLQPQGRRGGAARRHRPVSGLLGSVAALLTVRSGYETAVAARARVAPPTRWRSSTSTPRSARSST